MVKTIARTYSTTNTSKLVPSSALHPHIFKMWGHKDSFFFRTLVCTQGIWLTTCVLQLEKKEYFVIRHIILKLFIQVFQSQFLELSNYSTLQATEPCSSYSQDMSMLGDLTFKVKLRSNGSSTILMTQNLTLTSKEHIVQGKTLVHMIIILCCLQFLSVKEWFTISFQKTSDFSATKYCGKYS